MKERRSWWRPDWGMPSVAGHVELRVGGGAGNGQILKCVAEIGEAAALQVAPGDLQERGRFVDRITANARAGYDNFVNRGVLASIRNLGERSHTEGKEEAARAAPLQVNDSIMIIGAPRTAGLA